MSNTKTIKPKTLQPENKLDIAISVISAILVFFAVAGIFSCAIWVYLKFNPVAGPETHINTYAKTITDENGNERYLMELEYWDNSNGNGYEVAEFSFNAYSGMDCTTVLQKGVQWHNDTAKKSGLAMLNAWLGGKALGLWKTNYYDKDGGASWKSIEPIKVGDAMYLTIEGELYEMIMNGTYTTYTKQFNTWKTIVNVGKGMIGKANYSDPNTWYDYLPVVHTYTMLDFYKDMLKSMTATNFKYGENICSLVDLSKYFNIRKFNTDKKQWESLTEGHDVRKSYFSIRVTTHADGFRRAEESNYKMFNDDADFTLVPTDGYYEDYVNAKFGRMLMPNDFNYTFSANLGGYVAELKDDVRATFNDDALYTISINVNDEFFGKHKNIVAIRLLNSDYNYLHAINVNVHVDGEATFYIVDSNTDAEYKKLAVPVAFTNSKGTVSGVVHKKVV